jgi:hypothetical protein
MKEFCGEHAPINEENKGKIFDKFTVKMVKINNKREMIAVRKLLCGEILGMYPTLQEVRLCDIIETYPDKMIEDYKIPGLISYGDINNCDCVLEMHEWDCLIRVAKTIKEGEILRRTIWMTKPIDKYLKKEDDKFQEWTMNVLWKQRTIMNGNRMDMQISNDMHLGQFNLLITCY